MLYLAIAVVTSHTKAIPVINNIVNPYGITGHT